MWPKNLRRGRERAPENSDEVQKLLHSDAESSMNLKRAACGIAWNLFQLNQLNPFHWLLQFKSSFEAQPLLDPNG